MSKTILLNGDKNTPHPHGKNTPIPNNNSRRTKSSPYNKRKHRINGAGNGTGNGAGNGAGNGSTTNSKSKKKGPTHAKIQAEVVKMIIEIEQKNNPDFKLYKNGLKKLKTYIKEATGKEYIKDGNMSWMDALTKTKDYLSKK